MLNIGRMGARSQDYYLEQVARSTTGYHLGRGEAPGRWLGPGLPGVGLTAGATVTADQLGAVLLAQHPATGGRLSQRGGRTVPGFDLTFRAPKSVSLLWALGDSRTEAETEAAHRAAVDAAVGYLQRVALRSRRGRNGVETVTVDGLIAAGFDHRTSRAGDPLLHTHVLVANLARTSDDGRWRTIDSTRMYAHCRTAGSVYQTVLRQQLTRRLGVGWEPVVNSCADVEGVPRRWIEQFSKRRAAIVAELDRRGETSAAAAQVATLGTRQAKTVQPDTPTLRQRWRTEARGLGIPDGWHRAVVGQAVPADLDVVDLYRQLVVEEGLTQSRSTFTTSDLVREVADAAPSGATPEKLGQAVRTLLTDGRRSGLLVDATTGSARGGRRWTTRPLADLEQQTVLQAMADRHAGLAVADPHALDEALAARPTLSDEQTTMIWRLTTGWDGVAVVVGRAGTGKTYALDAARDAWQRSGYQVTGAALAARAALELQDCAGGRLQGPRLELPDGRTVRAGDRIVCLRNDRRLDVLNGTRGTITGIRADGAIDLATDQAVHVRLPAAYVEAGHVDLGYAITGHKAQGLTVDHTHVLGSDALYREWGYVAMSRGRTSNRLYLTTAAHTCRHGSRHPERRLLEDAVRGLRRATADEPITHGPTLGGRGR